MEWNKVDGKIVLVDDEKIEKDFLVVALQQKHWDIQIEYFQSVLDALEYLKRTPDDIFLIISDMNMPVLNGMDFKKRIDDDEQLRKKSIPFIFASTHATKDQITEAYDYRVQGYFKKSSSLSEQADMLDTIIQYWIISSHPNRDKF